MTPTASAAERQQRHEVADATGRLERRRRGRPASGAAQQADPGVRREQAHVELGELGHREEAEVGQRMVEPRPAEPTERSSAGRPQREGREHGQLGVRFVLVGGRARRHALAAERGQIPASPSESPSPTQRSMRSPSGAGVARATVRGDDQGPGLQPAGPRGIESATRDADVAVGEDDHLGRC